MAHQYILFEGYISVNQQFVFFILESKYNRPNWALNHGLKITRTVHDPTHRIDR